MKAIIKLEDLTTIDQLEDFLSGTRTVAFSVISDKGACSSSIYSNVVTCRTCFEGILQYQIISPMQTRL